MTRETKLVMAVAGMFLTLVTGVVAYKWISPDEPSGQPQQGELAQAEAPPPRVEVASPPAQAVQPADSAGSGVVTAGHTMPGPMPLVPVGDLNATGQMLPPGPPNGSSSGMPMALPNGDGGPQQVVQ